MGDDRIDGPTTRATTRPQAVAARLNRRVRLSQHSLSVSSRRSDPPPEILQLVENKTGTPDLVSSAISQCAQHAGIAKPADASNTLLRGASISSTASSEHRIGTPGNSARILAAALPRRTGPVNSRHWQGIS